MAKRTGSVLVRAACATAMLVACQVSSDDPVPGKTLYYYTWSDYAGPELLKEFEQRHNVRVVIDTFSSNEELLAKLQSGASGYDVTVPSDFMVAIMAKQGLLADLEPDRIPNARALEDVLQRMPVDPSHRFSVPYLWGTVGIGYDSAVLPTPPDSWAVLWDERYRGRISMLNDQREVVGAVLRLLGQSMNTRDPAVLGRARDVLLRQKPLVKTYSSDHYDQLLASGEVVLAHGWGGPVARAMALKPSIRYVVPKEGATIWADCLVIPRTSRNKELARAFINYLLDREVAARTSEQLLFASANREAKALVKESVRNNPAVYPLPASLGHVEWMMDVGEAIRLYDRIWTELKVS